MGLGRLMEELRAIVTTLRPLVHPPTRNCLIMPRFKFSADHTQRTITMRLYLWDDEDFRENLCSDAQCSRTHHCNVLQSPYIIQFLLVICSHFGSVVSKPWIGIGPILVKYGICYSIVNDKEPSGKFNTIR